ncbi:MAG: manganese efflux pump MntP family protein [Bacteroidales bacterium]|nr:manganese efflux pump MntP family protein [Bacteroidales bacterium]MDY0140551.1 manganese efflux pump MntP family protein [Bacteroidales bacterium]
MENLFTVLLIAIGLSMDSLTVSVAAAPTCTKPNNFIFFRFAFILGFIQATFTIAGWAAGAELAKHFQAYDHWIAFALLLIIGGKMLYEGIKHHDYEKKPKLNMNNVFVVAGLGVATSIDAAIVGVSLPFVGLNIWITALIIMIVTFVFSYIGLYGGKFVRKHLKILPIEIIGGVFLIAIGTKVLIEHLVRGC